MSIALEARVSALEKDLREAVQLCAELAGACAKLEERVVVLEQTAQRKPGPKPKDSNG